jgi:outer membrane receptor protein involved in Fe transport
VPLFLVICLVALPASAWAQSGRLLGTVTDADNGEPIPGATVVLEETGQGAAADLDGQFVILNISPGAYTIRVSSIGFTTRLIENVRITSDRPTNLDIELSTEVVQGGEIVVEALTPVVDQNQTTSRSVVTGEEIESLPVASLEGVIGRTSNAYDGFVRGSRRFETRTVVEGIDVSDSFYSLSQGGNFQGSRYSNVNRSGYTSASSITFNPIGVSEVTVNSGATEPQYNAGSGGVVAVSLAEGRGPIRGTISARIAPSIGQPGPDSLDFYVDAQDYLDDREGVADPLKRALYTWTPDSYSYGEDPEVDIQASIGGSITDDWTFALAGQWFRSNGYMPNQFSQRVNASLKSSYQLARGTELTVIGLYDDKGLWGGWNNTSYVEYWRFYLEGVAQDDAGSYVGSLRLRQVINDESYVTIQGYRTYDRRRIGYVDDDGDGFQEIGEDGDFLDFFDQGVVDKYIGTNTTRDEENDPKMFIDIVTDPFSETSASLSLPDGRRYRLARPSPFSEDVTSATNGLRIDYANQVTFNHFVQAGVEIRQRSFDYELVDGIPGPGSILNDEEEPFRFSQWERSPTEISIYASDRMQFAGLIVNVGARLNLIDRDMEEIENHYYPFQRDTITVAGRELARNNIVRGDDVPWDVLFNPSIGVSHPIGSTAAMYFSYSRSQQLAPYSQLYDNYDGIQTTTRFFNLVDPEQDPITSNNYELGLQWEFAPGWGADVNAYGRSIDNYGTVGYTAFSQPGLDQIQGFDRYSYITNLGYADARGIELTLRRRPLALAENVDLGVTASYTYSSVEQSRLTGDNLRDFRYDEETQETQLPFDDARDFQNFAQNVQGGSIITGGFGRRHRGVIRAVSNLPFGIGAGLLGTIESGFEYADPTGTDARDRALNTAPANYQLDLRLEKGVDFNDRLGIDLYLDVINLTDRDNVVAYETADSRFAVAFEETGVPGNRLIRNDGSPLYGPARTIYFGTRLRF